MTHIEWSDWIYNVLVMMGWKDSNVALQSFEEKYGQDYVQTIASKLGTEKQTVYDHLRLRWEDKDVRNYLKENDETQKRQIQ